MRIILIGPPGSDKRKFVMDFVSAHDEFNYMDDPFEMLESLGLESALGNLSDYRTELLLATARSSFLLLNDNTINSHTILDSLAHAHVRINTKVDVGTIDDQWTLTLVMLGYIVQDSLKYDIAVRMPLQVDDDYAKEVDKALDELVNIFGIKTITPEELSGEVEARQRADSQHTDV